MPTVLTVADEKAEIDAGAKQESAGKCLTAGPTKRGEEPSAVFELVEKADRKLTRVALGHTATDGAADGRRRELEGALPVELKQQLGRQCDAMPLLQVSDQDWNIGFVGLRRHHLADHATVARATEQIDETRSKRVQTAGARAAARLNQR
jgi:hypothetical protein